MWAWNILLSMKITGKDKDMGSYQKDTWAMLNGLQLSKYEPISTLKWIKTTMEWKMHQNLWVINNITQNTLCNHSHLDLFANLLIILKTAEQRECIQHLLFPTDSIISYDKVFFREEFQKMNAEGWSPNEIGKRQRCLMDAKTFSLKVAGKMSTGRMKLETSGSLVNFNMAKKQMSGITLEVIL